MLETHEEECLEFTQNTVPFDFNGNHLVWMAYLPQGIREIYSYHLPTKKRDCLLRFRSADGIISHGKLMGRDASHLSPNMEAAPEERMKNLKLFYVQHSNQIVMYDVTSKSAKLIGTCPDAILALHVSQK